jgi:hypothetical protein
LRKIHTNRLNFIDIFDGAAAETGERVDREI